MPHNGLAIHADFQRGIVDARMVSHEALMAAGSMAEAKVNGKALVGRGLRREGWRRGQLEK
ncbi:DUF933 domain-containing protein [Garicola koreensis]|uniref:Ribosome-binding ATPase YchF (GTP1/OBG family) n=1 Tax=Garicola koreensis TaxID=1262554 RepID=A0A7W5TNI8_9MICC|nr:ribosome-binding ATPase YchF (GTP1/OBG family) [Garicola koreensis]